MDREAGSRTRRAWNTEVMLFLFVLLACACCPQGAAQSAGGRDWAETAVDDLHFIRATLRENHPGPVDTGNPAFQRWYKRGFDLSIARARKARDFAGYFFAINYYMAGFEDGHMGALTERHLLDHLAGDRLRRRWPRFTLRYKSGGFVVDQTEGPSRRIPQVGEKLIACDGRLVESWAKEILGGYVGLWDIPGTRASLAPLLLIDEGNPFVKRPVRCRFRGQKGEREVLLDWQPISGADLRARFTYQEELPEPPSVQQLEADAYWIRLPSFATGDKKNSTDLKTIEADLRRLAPAIRRARLVVLDVRGNRGGNSEAGDALLAAIWGEAYVESIRPRPTAIDWRVSRGNIRFLTEVNLAELRRQFGPDSRQAREYEHLIAGMQQALDKRQVWYREESPKPPSAPAPEPNTVQPVLLTDNACASACLDFADVVLRLPGAQHAGLETSADAVYIDNRAVRLPSGLGWLGFSMKVYRGRARGNNQPYKPKHVYEDDINDTRAVQEWVLRGFPR
jgi:hypothetical protein